MSLPPIRRQVVVNTDPDVAYRAWLDEIGSWWPLERHAVFDPPTTVAFVGDRIVETSGTGEQVVWGTVIRAEPGSRLSFTWHPGRDADDRGVVEIAFVPIAGGRTLVTLEHRGWESYEDARTAREEYRKGWPVVLAHAAQHVAASDAAAGDDDEVWLLLEHTPGGDAGDVPFFRHPLFAEHRAFLAAAAEAGVLVAAGPLPDEPGHGQTVLRVPATSAAHWVAAAEADGSVAGDLFVLRVRPWHVQLAPERR